MIANEKRISLGLTVAGVVAAVAILLSAPAGADTRPPVTGPHTAAAAMDAFGSSGSLSHVPEGVAKALEYLPGHASLGESIPARVELLLDSAGGRDVGVYAFPTTKGAVCFVVSESGSPGSCVTAFDRARMPVAVVLYSGPGAPTAVAGVVPRNVVAADVTVDGVTYRARVTRGAIYFALPRGSIDAIEAVTAHYRDGRSAVQRFNQGAKGTSIARR